MSVNSQVARNQSRQTFDSVFESVGRQSSVFPLGSHYEGGQRMVEYFTGHSKTTKKEAHEYCFIQRHIIYLNINLFNDST